MSLLSLKQDCKLLQIFSFFMFLMPNPVLAQRKHSAKLCSTVFISPRGACLLVLYFLLLRRALSGTKHKCKENRRAIDRMQGVIETETIKKRHGHSTHAFKYIPEYMLAPGTQDHCLPFFFHFFFDHHIDKVEVYRQCHCTTPVKLALKVSFIYQPAEFHHCLILECIFMHLLESQMFPQMPTAIYFSDMFYCP